MKAPERDNLLVRLDERTRNIWRVTEKLERHQEQQNGFIQTALIKSSRNTLWIKIISSVGGAAILIIVGFIVGILNIGD